MESAFETGSEGLSSRSGTEAERENFSEMEEVKLFTAGLTEEFSEKEEVQLATEGLIEEFHDTDEQKDVLKETAERKGDQTMLAYVLAILLWIR